MLEDAKRNPPAPRYTVDDVVLAGRRLRTRRRAAWTGVAVATAVVAVGAAVGVPRLIMGHSAGPPAATSQPVAARSTPEPLRYPDQVWEYAFTGYRAGEFTVNDPFLVTADFQQASVRMGDDVDEIYAEPPKAGQKPQVARSQPAQNLLLTVYRPGRYSPQQFDGGRSVRVGDRPGLFKEDTELEGGVSPIPGQRGLAWQYQDDGWAVLNTFEPDPDGRISVDDMVTVAAGLHGVKPYPATAAMKLGSVPPGYRLVQGGRAPGYPNGAADEGYRTSLRLAKAPTRTRERLTDAVVADTDSVKDIWVNLSSFPPKEEPPGGSTPGTPYCNSGNPDLCYRVLPGGKYKVEIVGSGDTSSADLKRVLSQLTFADVDQPSTWFPLAAAAGR
ncbi:hypothetical protein [Actinoplanes sp. NPDC049265]|uniref:hypothetical protein n=1 Tax=Actinoplanes sp. NPDC049265 TaxID=3363902 RepID=UPI00372280E8